MKRSLVILEWVPAADDETIGIKTEEWAEAMAAAGLMYGVTAANAISHPHADAAFDPAFIAGLDDAADNDSDQGHES